MHEFRARRRVEFSDTDMGGIVHFSRFFVFMETTEHLFLEALGSSVHVYRDGEAIGWPRVSVSCEFISPARFGDVVEIHLKVLRKGRSSLTYGFEISRGGTLLARGRSTAVCCVLNDPAGVRPIAIPDFIGDHIEEAPPPETSEG